MRKKHSQASKALMRLPNYNDVLECLPSQWIEFHYASSEATQRTRSEYTRTLRAEFTKAARTACLSAWSDTVQKKTLFRIMSHYDIHHRLPVSFGGSNDFDNLVLIDKKLHRYIHRLIDQKAACIQKTLKDHRIAKRPRIQNLKNDLEQIDGVRLEENGSIMMRIPFPQMIFLIPHLFMLEQGQPPSSGTTIGDRCPELRRLIA